MESKKAKQTTADSRTKLLDATLTLVRTRGYSATTVDDICRAAGVTKGSFFHHFAAKDDLALAAADHFAALAAGLFKSAPYHAPADPRERVFGYLDFRAAILRGELPQFTCFLGTMVQETYESHPKIRAACERHITEHAGEVAEDLVLAKKKYTPRAKWSPESVALFTQAALQGAFILAKARRGPEIAAECVAHLRRYVESLLETTSKRR